MPNSKTKSPNQPFDSKEFELPETFYVRDIEDRVFQGIVLQCLSTIEGIALLEGNFIDNIFSRDSVEGVKGISIEQDTKNSSVKVKLEVNILYGIPIPQKAEEIQTKISEEITRLTGIHVSVVHVVFKNMIPPNQWKKTEEEQGQASINRPQEANIEEEYSEEF